MNLARTIADFQTQLTAKISVGATSATLYNNLDNDGATLPTGQYYFTLDGNNSLKEYIYCTLTGKNITAIYSVSVQGVKTAGTVREHAAGCLVSLTNFAQLKALADILNGADTLSASAPLIYDGTATINDDKKIATKAYADGVSITTPIAKATSAVYGTSKVSAAPEVANNPIALANNDPRVPTADEIAAMAGTGTPSVGNKFVTNDNSALDDNLALSGAQAVADVKTFSSISVLPAADPTTDNQAARKAYVDSKI